MKRSFFAVIIAVCVMAAFFAVSISFAEKTKSGEVPDQFLIKNSDVFKKLSKPGVMFTHDQHSTTLKIACTDCHHVYENGKNVWKEGDKVQHCAECHTSPKKNEGKTLSLYNAFHKNCRDCHKDAFKKDKKNKKIPTKCAQCHDKNNDK